MGRKVLRFVEFDGGCFVPLSHKLNQDGYFRKGWSEGDKEMFHRFIWRAHHGDIPEGYEIDHMCRNRACCNVKHLQVLDRTTHLVKTNKERYKDRNENAKEYWKFNIVTPQEVAEKYDVTVDTAWSWVRQWKKEAA